MGLLQIVYEARQRQGEARQRYLDAALGPGPSALRARVERLLAGAEDEAARRLRERIRTQNDVSVQDLGPDFKRYFHIERVIRDGGMGVVWEARWHGRRFAVKTIKPQGAAVPAEALRRFHGEVEALARLEHPHIVPVYFTGTFDQAPCFAMEYLPGDLEARLGGPAYGVRAAVELVEKVARAVAYAHRQGVVHRDLKPSNILLTAEGEPKVADFGIAALLGGPGGYTQPGSVLGTPEYMAPEQAEGRPVGPAADVYALGVILYRLLSGRLPIAPAKDTTAGQEAKLAYLKRVCEEDPRPLIGMGSEPAYVCKRCLEKRPADRYPSAEALADDLRRFLNHEPIPILRTPLWARAVKWARRHPVRAVTAAATLTVVVLAAWSWYAQGEAQAQTAIAAEMDRLRKVAETQREEAIRQRTEAEKQRALADKGKAEAVNQREEADRQRAKAEKLRTLADRQKADAVTQRGRAEAAEALARRYLYASSLNLADRAWQEGRVVRMQGLLDAQQPEGPDRPDLRGFEWHYLRALPSRGQRVFHGHRGVVVGVAFHPDGHRLASAERSGGIVFWDAASGVEVRRLGYGPIAGLAYTPDGKHLVTASGKRLQVREGSTGEVARSVTGHRWPVCCLACSPDGKLLATGESSRPGPFQRGPRTEVKIWDAQTWKEVGTLPHPQDVVRAVAFSPDSKRLAVIAADGGILVWDVATRKKLKELPGEGPLASSALAFDGTGDGIACPGSDGTVRIWDWSKGRQRVQMQGHLAKVHTLAFSPGGRRLAGGGQDATVKVWDATTGELLTSLKGHTHPVFAAAFAPDGRRLVSAGADRTVRVWDLNATQECQLVRDKTIAITGVAFSPDGRTLFSVESEGAVQGYDLGESRVVKKSEKPAGPVLSMARSADGKRLAFSVFRRVRIWDTESDQWLPDLVGHTGDVLHVAFSPVGNRLASGAMDGTVRVWDLKTGRATELRGHTAFRNGLPIEVHGVAFAPDGHSLASAGAEVIIWDLDRGVPRFTFRNLPTSAARVAYSPDGKRLAAAGFAEGTAKVWDTTTGKETLTLRGHSSVIFDLAFSPNNERLATASHDRTMKLWDLGTGQEVLTLRGHTDAVLWLAFDRDGSRLASGGRDGTVRLWEAPAELPLLRGHTGRLRQVAYSPDGKRLASASLDGTVRVWDAATGHQFLSLSHPGTVHDVTFSPDGTCLASGCDDGAVRLWDACCGGALFTRKEHGQAVLGVAFSPDGKRLASAGRDGRILLWDIAAGRTARTLTGPGKTIWALAFTPDGGHLVSGGMDGAVRLWDVAKGEQIWSKDYNALVLTKGYEQFVLSVAVTRDGKRIAAGLNSGGAVLLDRASGEHLRTFTTDATVFRVLFSPGGDRLVTLAQLSHARDRSTTFTEIKCWDTTGTGRSVTLPLQQGVILPLALRADGRLLASGGAENMVRFWEVPRFR
jgi:WD40 repeat protein